MVTLIFSTVLSLVVQTTPPDPIVDFAVKNCRHVSEAGHDKAYKVASILYSVEAQYDVPLELKGMILAASCMESGFNPKARGDRKFSKSGKKPMAIGVLQLWRYYEKAYGTDRSDPKSSAEGWMKHIARMLPKVKKQCRYKTPEKIWVAAWVTGIRYKKPGGRCRERPKHLRLLKKWKKLIAKSAHVTHHVDSNNTSVK
jgi:hypothetical protein